MRHPVLGGNVLYYDAHNTPHTARITRINPDHSVSLVIFPSATSGSNFQARSNVPYAPSQPNSWGWNEALLTHSDFVYEQPTPSEVWTISHSLGRYPSVVCCNQWGDRIEPDESHPNADQTILRFNPPTAGFAILN